MTTQTKNFSLKGGKEFIMIALGLFLYGLAWNLFLFPHRVAGGGATGIATIIMYATGGLLNGMPEVQDFFRSIGMESVGGGIPVSATFFLMNAVLCTLSIKILGWQFSVRSIYGVIMLTIWLWIPYRDIYQMLVDKPFPVFDPFMSSILAGLVSGVGMAITFVNNGSSGGTDILAKIINKYRDITLGRALLLSDFLVICSAILLPDGTLEKVVYGLIVMLVMTTTIDMYINGLRQSVQFFIFTQHAEEIAEAISQKAHRGVTLLDGMGWYSKQPVKVVTVLARKNESTQIFKIIKEIDMNAFIAQSAAIGVYGRGFEEIGKK